MKRVLPVLFLICIPAFLGAQQEDSFRLGIKGGPTYSFATGNVDLQNVESSAFTMGFFGGGFAEFVPIPWLSFEVGVFYDYNNYGVKIDTGQKVTLKFSSMDMPVMVKGRIPIGNGSLFLGGGVDLMLVVGRVILKTGNTGIQNAPDQVFHVAMAFSAGYDWLLKSGNNFTLELRYHRGTDSVLDTAELRANRFDLLFGWSVNL